jgi:hypothetical protein
MARPFRPVGERARADRWSAAGKVTECNQPTVIKWLQYAHIADY